MSICANVTDFQSGAPEAGGYSFVLKLKNDVGKGLADMADLYPQASCICQALVKVWSLSIVISTTSFSLPVVCLEPGTGKHGHNLQPQSRKLNSRY